MTRMSLSKLREIELRCHGKAHALNTKLRRLDTKLADFVFRGGYFAGGCIGSLIHDEEPKDWDIFLYTASCVYVQKWFEKYPEKAKFISNNAITLDNEFQIITRLHGVGFDVVRQFDFLHCQTFYSFMDKDLYLPENVWQACVRKRLISTLPPEQMSASRIQRFLKRGWTLDKGEMQGIIDLANADLGDENAWNGES